ncbi:hypothetical protein ACFYXM_35525, partial [Streptomyces sp. NPDC002476]
SLLGSLVPASGWAPDFLTPGPDHASPTTGAFDAIRATPRRRLTAELRRQSTAADAYAEARCSDTPTWQ